MKRSIIATILAATLLVSMAGMASAGEDIDIDPRNQTINVGEYGTYMVTIYTDTINQEHTISFITGNSDLLANLTGTSANTSDVDTGTMGVGGIAVWTPTYNGPHTFNYTVQPQSGIIQGEEYDMYVCDTAAGFLYPAIVIPSTYPTPEFATIAFVGIGLIGLVALGRRRT